jgi:starch synthase (maltosyl-transferring)
MGASGRPRPLRANLDPHRPREATVWLDTAALGLRLDSAFTVTDELTGDSYRWGRANYVRLDGRGRWRISSP